MSEAHEPSVSEPVDGETVDLGDERYVKQRKRSAKAHENSRAQVLRNIMGSIEGREWMRELLAFCDLEDNTFPNTDQIEMAYRVGLRRVGQHLMNEICDACPEHYARMRREARDVRD